MHQNQDQWLAGNVWNKRVYNAAGQGIGDVKDLLINHDGKVAAIVIGVGGFLGLGEKNVAVSFDFLQKNGSIGSDRIVLNMDEQALRGAPDFQRIKPSASPAPATR
jgi:sporulation protein YlmC with PRC-barrel domain